MRTLLLVTTFVLTCFAAFFSTDLLAGQFKDDATGTKKYAADNATPSKSFAGIVKTAHKKKLASKSSGPASSVNSKKSYGKKKGLKNVAGSKTGSSVKGLSKTGKRLSAAKKRLTKKLLASKHKLSRKSLKNKSNTRNYSAKSKILKDRTNRKPADLNKRSAAK